MSDPMLTFTMPRSTALVHGLLMCACGHRPNNHFAHGSSPCAVLAAAERERSEGQPCHATAAHGVHECTLQAGHRGGHRWDFEDDGQLTAEPVAAFVENLVSAPCSSRCLQMVADAIRRELGEGRSTPEAEDPRLREACPTCDRPVADDRDWRDTQPGEGEWLCWGEDQCRSNAVDWRARCIVQSGLRETAERELADARFEIEGWDIRVQDFAERLAAAECERDEARNDSDNHKRVAASLKGRFDAAEASIAEALRCLCEVRQFGVLDAKSFDEIDRAVVRDAIGAAVHALMAARRAP